LAGIKTKCPSDKEEQIGFQTFGIIFFHRIRFNGYFTLISTSPVILPGIFKITMEDEIILLQRLKKNDIQAFKKVFLEFYEPLEGVAFDILKHESKARETVTNVMDRMWKTSFVNVSLPIFESLCSEVKEDCRRQLE